MQQKSLNFAVILRVLVSLLPLLFGMPILSTIMCAYNITMSFIVFGPLTAVVSSICSVCFGMIIGGFYGVVGELSGFVLAVQAVLAAGGCIYGYLFKKNFYLGLSLSTIGVLIPQFLYIQHIASLDGLSVAQAVVPSSEDLFMLLSGTFKEMQVAVSAFEVNRIATFVNEFVTMLVPSVFIITSLGLAYVIMWTVSLQVRKLPVRLSYSFATIKLPSVMTLMSLFSIVGIVASFFVSLPREVLSVLFNISIVLMTICLFAGVSFVDFYLRKALHYTFVRLIIYAIVLLFVPISAFAFMLLACIDSFINIRKIRVSLPEKESEPIETEK